MIRRQRRVIGLRRLQSRRRFGGHLSSLRQPFRDHRRLALTRQRIKSNRLRQQSSYLGFNRHNIRWPRLQQRRLVPKSAVKPLQLPPIAHPPSREIDSKLFYQSLVQLIPKPGDLFDKQLRATVGGHCWMCQNKTSGTHMCFLHRVQLQLHK